MPAALADLALLFFLHFLQQVKGWNQYSGRQLLTPCQYLRSQTSSSSVPLSVCEAEFMAACPPSVTSGTVWLIWPVVLLCFRMCNIYCLPLACLLESAREIVQYNLDIHLLLSPLFCGFFFLSGSPLLSALPHFRAELQGRHGGRPRSWPGSSQGRRRNKYPVSEVLKAV